MTHFTLFCSSCEQHIDVGELAVMVAYVIVSDGRGFAVRTQDLFHRKCWNKIEGALNGESKEAPYEQPPPDPPQPGRGE